VESALRAYVLLFQQACDLLDPFVEASAAFVHRDAEPDEFVGQKCAGKPDFDPTTGDRVDHADLAGKLQRMIEHRQHGAGHQPNGLRHRCCGRQEDQRIRAVSAIRVKIVLHSPHVGESKLLCVLRQLQRLTPVLLGRLLARANRRKELDAKFHHPPHISSTENDLPRTRA
jgi:hypothetical protein